MEKERMKMERKKKAKGLSKKWKTEKEKKG